MAIFLQADVSVTDLVSETIENYLFNFEEVTRESLSTFVVDAQSLCALLILGFFSIQSYKLMTGDGQIQVVDLLTPFALSMVVSFWGLFVNLLDIPLAYVEDTAQAEMIESRVGINALYAERAFAMTDLYTALYESSESLEQSVDRNFIESAASSIKDVISLDFIEKSIAHARLMINAKIKLTILEIFETIMLTIFKAALYGLIYLRIIISAILVILGPFSFAISISGAFRDTWVHWLRKYVGVMLYGAMAYIAMSLSFKHIRSALITENNFIRQLAIDARAGDDTVANAFFWMGGYNHTVSYFMVAIILSIISFAAVPIIANWVLGSNGTTKLANNMIRNTRKVVSAGTQAVTKIL